VRLSDALVRIEMDTPFQNVLKTQADCFLSYNAFLLLCTVEVAG